MGDPYLDAYANAAYGGYGFESDPAYTNPADPYIQAYSGAATGGYGFEKDPTYSDPTIEYLGNNNWVRATPNPGGGTSFSAVQVPTGYPTTTSDYLSIYGRAASGGYGFESDPVYQQGLLGWPHVASPGVASWNSANLIPPKATPSNVANFTPTHVDPHPITGIPGFPGYNPSAGSQSSTPSGGGGSSGGASAPSSGPWWSKPAGGGGGSAPPNPWTAPQGGAGGWGHPPAGQTAPPWRNPMMHPHPRPYRPRPWWRR